MPRRWKRPPAARSFVGSGRRQRRRRRTQDLHLQPAQLPTKCEPKRSGSRQSSAPTEGSRTRRPFEGHDLSGEGPGQNSSSCRSHQEFRRIPRPGHQEVGEGRGRLCEGHYEQGIRRSRDQPSPERFGPLAGGVVPRAHSTTPVRVGGIGTIAWIGCPIRTRAKRPRARVRARVGRTTSGIGGVAAFSGQCLACKKCTLRCVRADASQLADGTFDRGHRRRVGIIREVQRRRTERCFGQPVQLA